MYIFCDQLESSVHEKKKLERFTMVICYVYIKHWNHCVYASDATIMDLRLYKAMLNWQAIDKPLANAVLKKTFKTHLVHEHGISTLIFKSNK